MSLTTVTRILHRTHGRWRCCHPGGSLGSVRRVRGDAAVARRCSLLHPVTDSNRPEWIAPSGELELRPRDGYIVSFVSFHEHGLGLPVDRFMRALPHYYGVELHNFNPNSIMQAAIFVAICEGYLGIAPHWELWLHLFRAGHTTKPTGMSGMRKAVRAGGCMLQVR